MQQNSGLAILSFVLGCLGLWGALWGAFPAMAIPIGLTAVLTGALARWSMRRKQVFPRNRRLALAGVWFGVVAGLLGFGTVLSLFLQQLSPDAGRRQAWAQVQEEEAGRGRKRMPNKPAAQFSSNLPVIVLETDGEPVEKAPPTVVRARVFPVENGHASPAGKPSYNGLATIHLRGNSTLHLPKRSYTLHTVDSQTNQTKVSLLGLPAEADWVLYAPYEDKTLIRDVLAYELANRMGHYAPRTQLVELFVQVAPGALSMRDYAGVYVLVEKIKRGHDRVNIAKLGAQDRAEPEITGGYLVKRDHNERAEGKFHTRHGGPYYFVYPKAADITAEQKRWLIRYFNSFESALYGPDFTDPQTGYAAYLDVDSFIDAHWLIELGKNVDGFRYSSFLNKDRNGKLKPEPPWDWNRAFGNANYYGGGQPQGWYWPHLRPNEISWYQRLREDPEFHARCARRWSELRASVFDPRKINSRIDELAAQLQEAQERNFQRWPVLGRQITCNAYVGRTYEDEVRWLKKWIDARIAWIDHQVKQPESARAAASIPFSLLPEAAGAVFDPASDSHRSPGSCALPPTGG